MNILLASAEVYPFAKAGGLADVSGYLPKEWEKQGHKPIVIMPKYGQIDTRTYKMKSLGITLVVPMGSWEEYATLWQAQLPNSTVPVYFVESADYFDRHGIYGDPEGFADNDRRFIFLSRAIFEAAKALNFQPDVILANDYHTAFAMPFLKKHYSGHPLFRRTAGVLSIHNMSFQGMFDPKQALFLAQIDMNEFYPMSSFECYGATNALKTGIMFADKVTTVSPRYALEIRYTDQGYGLQDVLNERGADVVGILNGVDYSVWNPETDEHLYRTYSARNLAAKAENKRAYLRQFGVPEDEVFADMPLIGMVTRLTDQKGIDLVKESLAYMLDNFPIRFTLLGTGADQYENFFRHIGQQYYPRTLVHIGYNDVIAHRIEAAADIFLMPSRFEPCGLNQMYSLKYGTIPVVRKTGGLADTVHEYDPQSGTGNGFVFDNVDAGEMLWAVQRAVDSYYNKERWQRIIKNAMAADYSAERSARSYIQVFEWALAAL